MACEDRCSERYLCGLERCLSFETYEDASRETCLLNWGLSLVADDRDRIFPLRDQVHMPPFQKRFDCTTSRILAYSNILSYIYRLLIRVSFIRVDEMSVFGKTNMTMLGALR